MASAEQRIQAAYERAYRANACRADRIFAVLMLVQLLAGVAGALWLTPRTWAGAGSYVHLHVWASLFMGMLIASAPLLLIWLRPGQAVTRYTVAVAQMLFSVLLIHISGGRIETHFHVFGSLAFLAFYRDWRVFVPATVVVAADHLLRGVFWPESVFGVLTSSPWRAFEHAGWVVFEDTFLIISCIQSQREMRAIATSEVNHEITKEQIEETVRRRTEELSVSNEALRVSEERYGLVVEGTREAVWDWDLLTNKVYYAPNWSVLLGLGPDEAMGDSPDDWFARIASRNLSAFQEKLNRYLRGESDCFDIEVEMLHADGTTRWMLCRAAASRDENGEAKRLTGSLSDISELKHAQNKLRRLAEFDQLTDLPNRSYFNQVLSSAFRDRRPDAEFAVVFFDFDRFKVINDSLGHNTGDALLKQIAERFRSQLREGDVVSRFGGDEFVMLLRHVNNQQQAESACQRMLKLFAEPYEIDGHSVVSTASIGLVMSSERYDDPDEMLRDADAAMYRAKSAGRDRFQVFDAQMHDQAMARLNLEHELRDAMRNGGLEMYYQPIVSTTNGKITGFESLIRWRHPRNGLMGPEAFLPLAEETGLIVEIGEWVFNQVCGQMRMWMDMFDLDDSFTMTVNVSRKQIIHPEIAEDFGRIIREHRVPAGRLCLEITESAIMDQRQNTSQLIKRLKDLGVKLALDDFGTGHSSLSCLHSFPIDVLKIDQTFIRNLGGSKVFSAVLNSIISLGHHLNMNVVGEGIDSLDQLVQLQTLDCEWAQGFYFARPMPADEATRLLADTPRWRVAA